MSLHSTLPGHPAGEIGCEPCETPRRRQEAPAERALIGRANENEAKWDAPKASDQRTGRKRVLAEHIDAIYTFIYARVGNRAEAEELTSRVFDRAAPRLERHTPDEALGLLIREARSVVEAHWQALSRGATMAPDWRGRDMAYRATARTSAADTALTALPSPAQRADRILRLLPAREREVLTYRFLMNRSVREIADLLLLTEDAVKALVYHALELAADLDQIMS